MNTNMIKLGEVFEILKGKNPHLSEHQSNGSLPYLSAKYMRGATKAKYASVKDKKSVVVTENDTVIICDGSNSGETFSGFSGILSSTMGKVVPTANVDTHYLRFFLQMIFSDLKKKRTGAAIPHLDIKSLYKTEIYLPPVEVQRQLVDRLKKAFQGLEHARSLLEQNMKNSNQLFESYLHDVFDGEKNNWPETKLADLCEIKHGFAFKSKYFSKQGEYVLLTPGNFFEKGGYRDRREKQKYYKGPLPEGFILSKGDLLVAMTEQAVGLLGSAVIIPESNKFLHNQRLGLINFKKGVSADNRFFFHMFNTARIRSEIERTATGVKVRHTSPKKILDIAVQIPTLSQQKMLGGKLDSLSYETQKLRSTFEERLKNLEELRVALLRQVFSGEFKIDHTTTPSAHKNTALPGAPSAYVRNQVHAAIIDQVVKDGGWTTEVAVAKYDHLLQEVFGLPLAYEFQTHQFGPFDGKIKRLLSSGLNGNKWFTKRSGMIVFGSNVRGLLFRQSNLYRNAQTIMRQLSNLGITKLDAEKVELLSTVCHSMKEADSIALHEVREFMSDWQTDNNTRTKADKFTAEETQRCIDFVIRNNLHQRLLQTT